MSRNNLGVLSEKIVKNLTLTGAISAVFGKKPSASPNFLREMNFLGQSEDCTAIWHPTQYATAYRSVAPDVINLHNHNITHSANNP